MTQIGSKMTQITSQNKKENLPILFSIKSKHLLNRIYFEYLSYPQRVT